MAQVAPIESEILSLFEMTPDLVCIAGKDGYFRKVNPSVIQKLEYTAEEIYKIPIASLIHPEDREYTARERAKLLEGKTLLNFQNRYISKTGKVIWLEWTSLFLPQKELVFAIAKDITENKRREIETEEKYHTFKSLATHFKSRVEEDRKYLARELHEEVAQLAAVVKMQVSWLDHNLTGIPEQAKNKIEEALVLSDLLIRTVRKVSFSISPNMMDDLGLTATLEWKCKEFSLLNGIPCEVKSNFSEISLGKEKKLDIYRICEEALSNIMEHAEAKSVKVLLEDRDDHITLSITDDGIGFDKQKVKPAAGIQNLEQLTFIMNGRLAISSEPGKGTIVTVTVPKG